MPHLDALESAVLDKLLAGPHPLLEVLREQKRHGIVVNRTFTGVGFFSKLQVSDAAPRVSPARSLRFGDVMAEISGLAHGAGFLLYVDDGVMTRLEGYAYDEPWPEKIETFAVRYVSGGKRDLSAL